MSINPNQKILTISVPTYNRAALVKGLLDSIVTAVSKYSLEDKVEVQITNNDSADNTEAVISEFTAKYNYIFYTKNEKNIGLGPNVLKCMYLAKGKYCLLLGDDDRLKPDSLHKLIAFLEQYPDTGLFVDTTVHKRHSVSKTMELGLIPFLEKYYYFMGNAGVFVVQSSYIIENYENRNFEGNSFSWPQTQLMIIAAKNHPEYKIRLDNLDLLAESEHANITLYNSFYQWKVAYYELMADIDAIREKVGNDVANAAKKYFSDNVIQNFFNILQCGVFVDDAATRAKTRKHIAQNLKPFSTKEKILLSIIIFVLWLPNSVARICSDIFIYLIRGNKGLEKKNEFVRLELQKLENFKNKKATIIREFSFDGAKS
jgi:glycosyltransferase involved in cell wall biosynthesis